MVLRITVLEPIRQLGRREPFGWIRLVTLPELHVDGFMVPWAAASPPPGLGADQEQRAEGLQIHP
jgi:hypothetical protein